MKSAWIIFLCFNLLICCEKPDLIDPAGISVDIEEDTVVFAQIGDFGSAGTAELKVSEMVKSWHPDFIISVGDNNYYSGEASTLELNISAFYGDYIYNYDAPGEFRCHGTAYQERINRFFPTPGNHDAASRDGLIPYYNYFTLPGNEKYYHFSWGPMAFYSLNSVEKNLEEQKLWLKDQLAQSTHTFNIVFFHHPPYSSGPHGDSEFMQWDFYGMGADIVFTGHDHIYERLRKKSEDGLWYIVNGLGGRAKSGCENPHDASTFEDFCYGSDYGALKATATRNHITLEFFAVGSPGTPIDQFVIDRINPLP